MEFVAPDERHVLQLAENMREEEIREIYAASGEGPYSAISQALQVSEEAHAAVDDDGTLLAITGVIPWSGLWVRTTAVPWLLTTQALPSRPRNLLRGTKIFVDKWKDTFPVLFNHVDARYEQSVRWAKWAGFTVHPAVPYGFLGLPFHKIEIRND